MALREILASFGVEFDKEGNLGKGDKTVEALTEKLAGFGKFVAGAFAVDKIVDFTKELIGEASALSRQATILGTSTKELEEWQYAAARAGIEGDEFTAVVTKLSRNINEAAENAGGPAAKAFKALGVSVKDSTGQLGQPLEILDGVVEGLQNIQDPAKRTAVVMDLFGRSGARLLPLFNKGPEGIRKLKAEVEELGAGMDETFIAGAKEYKGNVARLNLAIKGLGIQIIGPILPGLGRLTTYAVQATKSFVAWIKQTSFVRGGLLALSTGGIGALLGSLPRLLARFGGLTGALTKLGTFALRTVLPFLALEDAIGFLAGDDSVIGEGLDKLFGSGTAEAARKDILDWFNKVKDVVVQDFLPALKSIATSELFSGAAKGALESIAALLNAIGLALTDNAERAEKFAEALKNNLRNLGLGPSEAEQQKAIDEGLPENRKPLTEGESTVRKVLTTVFGDPLEQAAPKADLEKNNAKLATRKALAAPVDAVFQKYASPTEQPTASASAPLSGGYASAFAQVPSVTRVQQTVAPVTQLQVIVHDDSGAPAEVGNRVGKAAAKVLAPANLNAVKAALVPTPG